MRAIDSYRHVRPYFFGHPPAGFFTFNDWRIRSSNEPSTFTGFEWVAGFFRGLGGFLGISGILAVRVFSPDNHDARGIR
jgi:hypothetical protein